MTIERIDAVAIVFLFWWLGCVLFDPYYFNYWLILTIGGVVICLFAVFFLMILTRTFEVIITGKKFEL